jgi:bacteriorhodopsin
MLLWTIIGAAIITYLIVWYMKWKNHPEWKRVFSIALIFFGITLFATFFYYMGQTRVEQHYNPSEGTDCYDYFRC